MRSFRLESEELLTHEVSPPLPSRVYTRMIPLFSESYSEISSDIPPEVFPGIFVNSFYLASGVLSRVLKRVFSEKKTL